MEGMKERSGAYRMFVDERFIETYRIPVIAGRPFSPDRPADKNAAFVVNESLLRLHGGISPSDAIGRTLTMRHGGVEKPGQIIGVVGDFHIQSLHDNIEEVLLTVMPSDKMNFVSMRIAAGRTEDALAHIREVWARQVSSYPLDYHFLDDDFDRVHREDIRVGQIFGIFAALALTAACLGLFGLASYAAEQRSREVGVRRILGASLSGVAALLSREFLLLVAISVLLAWPIAYVTMDRWLSDFAFRAEMTWWMFAGSGCAALAIAMATVSMRAVATAMKNPTTVLRYE
jgi:putative ABC transport system permease protein